MHVKLLRPHTHAGREYPAGAELKTLRPAQVEWLEAVGTAEPASPEPAPIPHTEPAKAGKKE